MDKDYVDRANRAAVELRRATQEGECFIVITDSHLIASGNREWFQRIMAAANDGIKTTAAEAAARRH